MLKARTVKLRKNLSLTAVKLFTPKLAAGFKSYLEYSAQSPRPFTTFLKQQFGKSELTGVEIGFGFGDNALSLLQELNIKRLYCVDPFIQKPYCRGETCVFQYADEKFSKHAVLKSNSKISFVELPSHEAFSHLPENLDFVYVDGNHDYGFVIDDLRQAYKHLVISGYVGGHDFVKAEEENVVKAVFTFAREIRQNPTVRMPDFWFKRNGEAQ